MSLPDLPLIRRWAFPLGALALAIAGLRVSSGAHATTSRGSLAVLPAGFREVTAGLVLLGIFGVITLGIRAHRSGLWLWPGIILVAWSTSGRVAAAPIGLTIVAGAFIVFLVAVVPGLGRVSRLRSWFLEADQHWLGSPAHPRTLSRPAIFVLVLSTLCSAFAPHVA